MGDAAKRIRPDEHGTSVPSWRRTQQLESHGGDLDVHRGHSPRRPSLPSKLPRRHVQVPQPPSKCPGRAKHRPLADGPPRRHLVHGTFRQSCPARSDFLGFHQRGQHSTGGRPVSFQSAARGRFWILSPCSIILNSGFISMSTALSHCFTTMPPLWRTKFALRVSAARPKWL